MGSEIKQIFWFGHKVKIISYSGSFAYVKDVNTEDKGYIHTLLLKDTSGKLSVNRSYDHVYVGATNLNNTTGFPRMQATYDGSGEIRYSTDNPDIIYVDQDTGLITGKKPGKANFIASVNGKSVSRPVHCIYKWKKAWTGEALTATKVRTGPGTGYSEISTLAKGSKFIVGGDEGGSDGWAYGNVQGTNTWGFVKIADISTKGTVSQYNSLGWRWPIENTEYNYINSPYGTRKTNPTKHKGFDISTNWNENQLSIEGETVVSAFKGTVDYVCINSSLSWGYCVSIISDEDITDPVSEKQFVAIYMHMKNKPKVSRGKEVSKGTELGYVGSTGRSTGEHLHFEANNQTASIYELNGEEVSDPGRSSYNDLINPVFFYMSFNPKYRQDSEAEKYYNGTFWYGSE